MKRNSLAVIATTLLIGTIFGLLTSYGQTYLPAPFTQLANSYAVWLTASFLLARVVQNKWQALMGGAFVQYVAILTYYVVSNLRFGTGGLNTADIVWFAGGTVMGPIIAYLAYRLRLGKSGKELAVPALTGLYFSEGLYQFIFLKYMAEGWVFVSVGAMILVVCLFGKKLPVVKTLTYTAIITLLMAVGYGLLALSAEWVLSGGR